MQRRALITGITGQDSAYLAQFLLGKDYEVFGLVRRSSIAEIAGFRLRWLDIKEKIKFVDGDLTDFASLISAIKVSAPGEVYNLAAQSFVKSSWAQQRL